MRQLVEHLGLEFGEFLLSHNHGEHNWSHASVSFCELQPGHKEVAHS